MEHSTPLIDPIVAEIGISYTPRIKLSRCPLIKDPKDAYELLLASWDTTKIEYAEQFKVMLLNRAKRVLGICTLSTGSPTGTIADPKQVFSVALKANAMDIILAHNHPSGNLAPSSADITLTERMKQAGLLLDLRVVDHIIVTTEGYYSFAEQGAL